MSESALSKNKAVQRVLDRAVSEGGLPGILAEVRDGDRTWFGTAGVSDLESWRPRQPHDRFRIGSTTKTFVAVVVLRLVAGGQLSLDDTVEKWLPDVVRGNGHDGSRITIRQLLNHTSGIFNYSMDPDLLTRHYTIAFLEHRYDSFGPEDAVRVAMAHPPTFEPGQDWGYSNTAFILAGMIVERVTGKPFADELARVITCPLGLHGTYLPRGEDPTIGVPHGRYYSKMCAPDPDAQTYDITELNPAPAWTAGGMVSTAGDLNLFFGALFGGTLLGPTELAEMFHTVPTHDWLPAARNARYGLAIASLELPGGATVWGMGGAIQGSWSYSFGTRDGQHHLTVNVNGDWAHSNEASGGWAKPTDIFDDVLAAELS